MIVTEAVPDYALILIAHYLQVPASFAHLLDIFVQIGLGQAPQTTPDPAGRTLFQHDRTRRPICKNQESR